MLCFSLAAFNSLSLSLFFVMLTTICLGVFCFCFFFKMIQFRLCASSQVREVSSYYIFKYSFSLLFFGDPIHCTPDLFIICLIYPCFIFFYICIFCFITTKFLQTFPLIYNIYLSIYFKYIYYYIFINCINFYTLESNFQCRKGLLKFMHGP